MSSVSAITHLIDANLKKIADMQTIVSKAANQLSVADGKAVLSHLAGKLSKLTNDECLALCVFTVKELQPKINLLFKEEAKFRRELAQVQSAKGDPEEATRTLIGINYGGQIDTEEQADDFITISEIDPDQADFYLKKCAGFIKEINNKEIQLRYRQAQAKLNDSKREFVTASKLYYSLSLEQGVDDKVAMELYDKAIQCAILGDAGSQKSRMLNILCKDARINANQFVELLKKMTMSHIIREQDVKDFESQLEEHQNIVRGDGYKVLDKALIQHNIAVVSKIYMNITFEQLGTFLRMSALKAEEFVADMIAAKTIQGELDQVNQIVVFEEEGHQQQTLNTQISSVCESIQSMINDVVKKHPDLVKFHAM